MAGETLRTPEIQSNTPEVLTPDKRPIVLLGAGSGLGAAIAERFSIEGHTVYAGTRSPAKFEALRTRILTAGGAEPKPLIADITKPAEFTEALNNTGLQQGEPVHYFPVAAGGMENVNMLVARQVVGLKRAIKRGASPDELAEIAAVATQTIKEKVETEEVLAPARDINVKQPVEIYWQLQEKGHFDKNSWVLNTSSSISNEFDPEHPERFRGPMFYLPVALKEASVRILRQNAHGIGHNHLDAVAPELPDTAVGGFIDGLVDVMQAIQPDKKIEVPKTPTTLVADEIYKEIVYNPRQSPTKQRTLFIDEGYVGYKRPQRWDEPFLPYL
jgi:hypothetical protein